MPIIAIGASAGGLDAASKLLDAIPPITGMAFILVQHLDPTHKSMMVDLLTEHTKMKIVEATDDCPLSPDHIYVIPPGRYLSVRAGALHLSPRQALHGARLPFDFLLKSLADGYGQQTVGVILSGTGADGRGALSALKAAGGYVIAQKPEEAEYDGIPRSAIGTGLVDRILEVYDIPQALADYQVEIAKKPTEQNNILPSGSTVLNEIIGFLKDKTSHDFTQYKPGTLERRIERRIALLALVRGNLVGYLDLLRRDPTERDLLAKDLLINVTSGYRLTVESD
ncbi:chemotaxis protein CheB [Sphingomonas sp. UYP23]